MMWLQTYAVQAPAASKATAVALIYTMFMKRIRVKNLYVACFRSRANCVIDGEQQHLLWNED